MSPNGPIWDFLCDKPGEELLHHRIYVIWLNPYSLQNGCTCDPSTSSPRGFLQPTAPQHLALLSSLTSAIPLGGKWCLFVILICTTQFAFDLCDSQLVFFSCVTSIENVSQALFRASHKYRLVFLPCLSSSLMIIRCNQRQTNSFLQSLAYIMSGIVDIQVPEF